MSGHGVNMGDAKRWVTGFAVMSRFIVSLQWSLHALHLSFPIWKLSIKNVIHVVLFFFFLMNIY